jgi:hypothetical protein
MATQRNYDTVSKTAVIQKQVTGEMWNVLQWPLRHYERTTLNYHD